MSIERKTIQIEAKTKEQLKQIADYYRRSMAGQVAWLIQREYENLEDELQPDPGDPPFDLVRE